jgi:tetratricopeptide (TPR) repeat protein
MVCTRKWVAIVLAGLWIFFSPALAKPQRPASKEVIEKTEAALSNLEVTEHTGTARGKLHEKIGDAHLTRGHHKKAAESYLNALNAYASSSDMKKLHRLLKRLSRKKRNWPKVRASTFAELNKAFKRIEVLHKKANKKPRRAKPPEDIDTAAFEILQEATDIGKLARRIGVPLLQARSLEVEGRVMGASGEPEEELKKYQQAAQTCEKAACEPRMRRILGNTARLLEKRGKLNEAFALFAKLNAESNAHLSEEQRMYARSKDLTRLCRRIRRKDSAASCLRLEKRAVGYSTFVDFSQQRSSGILTKDAIDKVHEAYLPLLHECLFQAARNGEVEPGESLSLFWAITNEGRTDRFQCTPPMGGTVFESCIKKALAIFRYPRYSGERRTVSIPLSVNR